jgi:hypothetical protein
VNRTFQTFSITDFQKIKTQMLNWGNRFNICAFLDNHQYQLPGHEQECLAGFGCVHEVKCDVVRGDTNHGRASSLEQLQQFLDVHNDGFSGAVLLCSQICIAVE